MSQRVIRTGTLSFPDVGARARHSGEHATIDAEALCPAALGLAGWKVYRVIAVWKDSDKPAV